MSDSTYNTLLHYVCFSIKDEHAHIIIKYLILHGAKSQVLNTEGNSPLHFAAQQNKPLSIALLIKQGAFVNGINYHGLTPCHLAAISDAKDAYITLQEHKASVKMEAFPSAINLLPFEWDSKEALTAIKMIERKNGQIEAYLNPKKIIPEVMPEIKGWELFLISELNSNALPEKNKLYLEKSADKLRYVVLDPTDATKQIESTLDINIVEENLTKDKLASFKSKILLETLKRGHIQIKPDSTSIGHQALGWTKDKFYLGYSYANGIYNETCELESTSTYQMLGMAKIGISVVGALYLGPYFAGIELGRQALLYARPSIMGAGGHLYYYLKPGIHNYTWPCISSSFDYGATGLSYTSHGAFKLMNCYDLATNLSRRAVGATTGVLLLKLAQNLGVKNKEYQAATLFLAKEAGYALVDAYHAASPEKKTHKALTENNVDPNLNHAYKVWTSILGKDKGESFVSTINLAHQWQDYIYTNLGERERNLLKSIEGYTSFNKHIENLQGCIAGYLNFSIAPLEMVKLELNTTIDWLAESRDNFLIGLNQFVHTHAISKSEYQTVMLIYVHQQIIMLHAHSKQKLEQQLVQVEIAEDHINIDSLKTQIIAIDQKILESEACIKQFQEQLSNGTFMNQYHAAQKKAFNAWSEQQDLETLKELNPESFVDMAYDNLGSDLSERELTEFLTTMINAQNIPIHQGELMAFMSKIDASGMQAPSFKETLKSALSTFWAPQVERHIAHASSLSTEAFEQAKGELEEAAKEFAVDATPEELRGLTLDQNPEVKKQRYDLILIQKNAYIQKMALTHARYADFIQDSLAYEKDEQDLFFDQTILKQTEHECEQEITILTKDQERLQNDLDTKIKNPTIESIVSTVEKVIIHGDENSKIRNKTTNLMLSWLVSTGLITPEASEKYRGDFYDSLKCNNKEVGASVAAVLNKATKEVFDKAQAPLVAVQEKINSLRQEIENAKQQVDIKTEALAKQKEILNKTKETTLSKLKPDERYQFKQFTLDLIDSISRLNKFNQTLMDQYYAQNNHQEVAENKKNTNALLEKQLHQLEIWTNLTFPEDEIWEIVNTTIDNVLKYKDFKPAIINFLVKKELGEFKFLSDYFNILIPYYEDKDERKAIYKGFRKELARFLNEHVPTQIGLTNNIIEHLKNKIEVQDQDLKQLQEKLQCANTKVDLAKAQYLEKLSPEEKIIFSEKEAARKTAVVASTKTNSQDDIPDWNNPAHVIGSVVNEGFEKYSDKKQLAEFLADKIMLFKSQRYGENRDKEAIEKERQILVEQLYEHELDRFTKNPHRTKNRLYDYIFAKVNNIEKKPHQHRAGRIIKPVMNEIVAELSGGYIPFKDFKGGEGRGGQGGLQLAYRSDGTISVNIHSNGTPVLQLYQSERPARRIEEQAQPAIFQKNWETTKVIEPVAEAPSVNTSAFIPPMAYSLFQGGVFGQAKESFPGPLRPEFLPESIKNPAPSNFPFGYQGGTSLRAEPSPESMPEEIKSASSLNTDNPYVQKALETEFNKLFGQTLSLGSEKKPEAKKQSQPKKPSTPKPSPSAKVTPKPVPKPKPQTSAPPKVSPEPSNAENSKKAPSVSLIFSKPNKPEDGWWKMVYQSFKGKESVEISTLKRNMTQATPKWLVQFTLDMKEVSYPVEQLPRIVVEALGETAKALLEDNFSLDNFFKAQSFDELIAEEKLRQQSYFMMAKFLGDDVAKILAKEKPESLKHTEKFISNFYHASQEDKLKGLVKIGIAACAYNFLKLRNPRLVSSAFGHISKSENNAAPLALQGPPKTFLPNYSYRPTPAVLLRHDQRINTTYLGEYNPHEVLENQGPIPDRNIETFMGATFKSYRLEQDIVLSRVGNSFEPLGQYFSFSKSNGEFSDRIDRALLPQWDNANGPNIVDTAYYVNIPRGTTIHVGLAAPQGGIYLGGTEQIFITKPWSIPGVSVVFRHPIKEAHLWNIKVTK